MGTTSSRPSFPGSETPSQPAILTVDLVKVLNKASIVGGGRLTQQNNQLSFFSSPEVKTHLVFAATMC